MAANRLQHPAVIRLCHWFGGLAVIVLIGSGLQIFVAFPSFGEKIPEQDFFIPPAWLRLGAWLAGAQQLHFTFAWVLVASGVVYLVYQTVSGNYRQVLFAREDVADLWPMIRHYVLFGPRPPQRGTYNPLQKLAYTTVIVLGIVAVVTGFALYKPVQLSWLVAVLGGFRLVRIWHFAAMCGLLAFIPGHLVMVALHGWGNFASMWTGGGSGEDGGEKSTRRNGVTETREA